MLSSMNLPDGIQVTSNSCLLFNLWALHILENRGSYFYIYYIVSGYHYITNYKQFRSSRILYNMDFIKELLLVHAKRTVCCTYLSNFIKKVMRIWLQNNWVRSTKNFPMWYLTLDDKMIIYKAPAAYLYLNGLL